MEIILPMLLVPFAAWAFLTLLAVSIAHGNGKMESEDFPFSKPTAKLVRKVDGKTPTPEQTTVKSETVKTSEKIVVSSQGLSETTYVHRVMQRQPRYCFEYQSVDEVRKIMREGGLSFLVVLDHNMRMVGIVTMEDLARHKKQDTPEPDASQGGK
jgi:CBS domain-containing protein